MSGKDTEWIEVWRIAGVTLF